MRSRGNEMLEGGEKVRGALKRGEGDTTVSLPPEGIFESTTLD